MSRNLCLSFLFGAALLIGGWSFISWMVARPPAPVTGNDVTYICLETKEVVEGPLEPVPAVNPATGRRTLVLAVYSNATKAWVPAPSEEVLRKNRQMLAQEDGKAPLSFAPPEEPDDAE